MARAGPGRQVFNGPVKMLLTSGGVRNPSLRRALVDLLGRPIESCTALCIPTGAYAHPYAGPVNARRFVSGDPEFPPMTGLGWQSVGLLELTALPSLDRDRWQGWVRDVDALVVEGGDVLYLAHWMRESGLADLLDSLDDLVWCGLSAGSMVMTPAVGEDFIQWRSPGGDTETLGLVDFSIFPHLDVFPDNSMADAERWAASIGHPSYALDDESGLRVVDGEVEVVSEGRWRFFDA